MSPYAAELDSLLREGAGAAEARASSWYDQLTGPRCDGVVLFGAGGHGRNTLRKLRGLGIEPLAFSDNNSRLWGCQVDGLPVLPPEEACGRFGRRAAFVVTVFNPGPRAIVPAIRAQLRSLGCRAVVPFTALAWKYPEVFLPAYSIDLPHKVLLEADRVREAFSLWADDQSRREYLEQIRWRLLADHDRFSAPLPEVEYFPDDLIRPRTDEVFVDCGAFDGDTIKAFLGLRGEEFGRIVAFEPDMANFNQLASYVAALPAPLAGRIQLHRAGVGRRRETLRFQATGDMGAAISRSGEVEIDCVSLDEALADLAPTYIKLDIEAAEPDALAGATKLVGRHAPVLAVCVYHLQDHLWRIPLQIRSLHEQYTFFLRRYEAECWGAVCYAVPRSRLRGARGRHQGPRPGEDGCPNRLPLPTACIGLDPK